MRYLFFYSFIFIYSSVIGQIIEPKFGKISDAILNYDPIQIDSSAEAVKLFDYGLSMINYNQNKGWVVTFERHTAIKIVTSEGYKYANKEVLLYHNGGNKENFGSLKGITYNHTGGKYSKTKLEKSSIYAEETNDFWDKSKFTMPDVKEGSVIEYRYKIISPFIFNLPSWTFQGKIPTVYSEYVTRIPEYFNYRKISQGYYPLSVNEMETQSGSASFKTTYLQGPLGNTPPPTYRTENYQENINRMVAKNIPAMTDESFVRSLDSYVLKIEHELQYTRYHDGSYKDYRTSWEALNKSFLDNSSFGEQLDKTAYMKEVLATLRASYSGDQLLSKTYDFVRNSMTWDGFRSKYVDVSLRDAYRNHSGNSADINLMLTAALKEQGFDAYPVLISTRANGLVRPNFPSSKQFDYLIACAKVGSEIVLLDATDKNIAPGYLPSKCLNDKGWAVSESGGFWVNLDPQEGHKENYFLNVRLEDESLKGQLKTKRTAYASFDLIEKHNADGQEGIIERYAEQYPEWIFDDYSAEILSPLELKESVNISVTDAIEKVGNLYLITPILLGSEKSNPFKQETREYPIDFTYPRAFSYTMTIDVPEGYTVDELPQPTRVSLPENGGSFLFNSSVMNNKIMIINKLQIKNQVYQASQYPYLKQLYKLVVDKHAERIVLKKST